MTVDPEYLCIISYTLISLSCDGLFRVNVD